MSKRLQKYWWIFMIRGIAAILFGIIALFLPADIVIETLMFVFAAYLLVDGGFSIGYGLANRDDKRWLFALFEGVIGILAGIGTILYPGLTALVLLYILAAWAIFTGVLELWLAYELRRIIQNEWFLAIGGVLSVLFGLLLISFPGSGIVALLWLVGAYSIVFGGILVVLSLRFRSLDSDVLSNDLSDSPTDSQQNNEFSGASY